MTRLGYTRYVAQGGDVGAGVTDAMGRLAPKGLRGIHLNFLAAFPPRVAAVVFGGAPVPAGLSAAERAAYAAVAAVYKRGYIIENIEHPQTIGYAESDSPTALAAWMLDHDADSYAKISRAFLGGRPSGGLTPQRHRQQHHALLADEHRGLGGADLLGGRTGAPCRGRNSSPDGLPAAYSVFPGELVLPPHRWLEQVYPHLIYFHTAKRGGHFAAWEEPELFATELRAAFRSLR